MPYKDKQKRKKYLASWKSKNRDKVNEYYKKDKIKNPLYYKIKCFTQDHFERDKLCGICNGGNKLQFHHWRYRFPVQQKDFSTLCASCHKIQHMKRRFTK